MALSLLLASAALAATSGPSADCQSAIGPLYGGVAIDDYPNLVDGTSLASDRALISLRQSGDNSLLVIRGGDFAGADLRGARLSNICFIGTDLSGSDWTGAQAHGVGFIDSSLEGARLVSADLRRVLFRNANLKDVLGEGANLAGGRLDGGWFDGSVENLRLDQADLRGFTFSCGITIDDGCPVYQGGPGIRLNEARLAGASLWGVADYEGARVDSTEVALGDLWRLSKAQVEGPVRVRGGDELLDLAPDELRSLVPHLAGEEGRSLDSPDPDPPQEPPYYASPGRYSLFVDGERHFKPTIRNHDLYKRLLPVIVGASFSRVVVRFGSSGTLDSVGESIGSNAHMCTLSANGLRLDPGSGFYSGPQPDLDEDSAEWRGRPMAVLRLDGDYAQVHVGGAGGGDGRGDSRLSDYASCGARAAFVPMLRLSVPQSEARRWFEVLSGGDL